MEGERGLFTILPSKPLPHPQHGRSTTTSSTTTSSTTTRSTTAIKTTSSITCNTLALSTISSTKHIYWYHNYSTVPHVISKVSPYPCFDSSLFILISNPVNTGPPIGEMGIPREFSVSKYSVYPLNKFSFNCC